MGPRSDLELLWRLVNGIMELLRNASSYATLHYGDASSESNYYCLASSKRYKLTPYDSDPINNRQFSLIQMDQLMPRIPRYPDSISLLI